MEITLYNWSDTRDTRAEFLHFFLESENRVYWKSIGVTHLSPLGVIVYEENDSVFGIIYTLKILENRYQGTILGRCTNISF